MTGNVNLNNVVANMKTPLEYLHQILDYIPDTINFIVRWLNEPIVEFMTWTALICRFLFRLLDRN